LTYAGLFVVTLSTLAYEIVLTRIFSVTMWYHFAFVAISVALFGTTAGALIVHLRPERFTEDNVKRQMARYALAYAVSIAVAFSCQLALPFRVEANAGAMASIVLTCALISVPFVLAGVVVCLALTKFGDKVNRLYAADLIGGGLGCLGLVIAFNYLDGPSLVIAVAAVAALGGLLFAIDAGYKVGKVVGALAVVALLVGALGNDALAARNKAAVKILYTKDERDHAHLADRWNAFSRLTVDGNPDTPQRPFGNGLSVTMPDDVLVDQLNILIDSTAGTVMTRYSGDPDQTDFLRYDISNLVYQGLEERGIDHAAIIGVGGGRDVLSALEFGAKKVTGIEINGNMLDLVDHKYGDFTGHLNERPGVHLVNDEARSYLTRSKDRYDSIQISLIDTWAATGAGAFALTENSLYTTQAWGTFFDKLQPHGILSVSRWFHNENAQPLEVLRTTELAAQALRNRGVKNPRDHILIYEGPPSPPYGATVGTVMVSPEPFSKDVLDKIESTADRMKFTPVLTPDYDMKEFPFADIVQPGGPGPRVKNEIDADISPPTDNRPFFFNMAKPSTVIKGLMGNDVGNKQVFRPVITLAALAFAVLLIAGVCIGGPLIQIGRRTSHKGRSPYYLYFCGIGLGFLMVEVSQMMRLSTFLGHPTYAFTVVLFTVLLFSGLGSMTVGRIISLDKPRSLLIPLLALLALAVVFGMLTPQLIHEMASKTTPVRIGTAIGLLAPLAFLMGMPFSIGMRMASTDEDSPTAFLWGINGAMSVVASVFATVIALFLGIYVAFYMGVLAYVLAAVSLWRLVRRLESSQAEAPPVSDNGDAPAGGEPEAADEEPSLAPA
jgi:hypothetical protein